MPDSKLSYGVTLTIVDIARLLRRRFEQCLTEVDTGVTVAEARALTFVWRNPNLRQAALAERMGVEPMTVVGYLDGLERAGLISRTTDPSDRRAKLVNVTPEADPVLDRIESVILKIREETLSGVPAEHMHILEDTLATLRQNLCSTEKDT